jgi:hypothetical protein
LDNLPQKLSHLRSLYHLACADDNVSSAELTYIRIVADNLGVDRKELDKFDSEEPVLELPDREYKIYALFHRLAIITMIDNNMQENERQFCFTLGIKMGLHPNAIGDILDHIEANGAAKTTPRDVMKIFRKYLS